MKSFKEMVETVGLKTVLSYIDSDPETNIPKILKWVEKFDSEENYKEAYNTVREILADPEHVWTRYMKNLYRDFDVKVRKKIFENFVINATITGLRRRNKNREQYGCNIPWAVLLDPTSACNLKCTGCWAADYGNQMSLSFDVMDSIITQGKEIGTYMYLYSGGEPLVRKNDIIKLCEKHGDCIFAAFTNGTLIDEKFADDMLRVGNFVPGISVEGFEEETDMRRGKGTYAAVIKAMQILKDRRLAFGFSACYHRYNTESVGSEAFLDDMIERGCKFGWYFTYMPVGVNAHPDFLATAEQRAYMYSQIRGFRDIKPIFTMDFWNDGEFVDGCIAGGRRYLHINANGDIEPCAFIHYSDSNIKEKTLLEALRSPLFMEYKKAQPFNNNHLRPCPLLDNKDRLAVMVHTANAKSTDLANPEDVDSLCAKCHKVADCWEIKSEELWAKSSGIKEAV